MAYKMMTVAEYLGKDDTTSTVSSMSIEDYEREEAWQNMCSASSQEEADYWEEVWLSI